jgi:hypothetical protein
MVVHAFISCIYMLDVDTLNAIFVALQVSSIYNECMFISPSTPIQVHVHLGMLTAGVNANLTAAKRLWILLLANLLLFAKRCPCPKLSLEGPIWSHEVWEKRPV